MKILKILVVLTLLFEGIKAQDTLKPFEFGSTLITFNTFNPRSSNTIIENRSPVEYINGLFFRYTKKRLGFRVLTSYSENYYSYTPPANWMDAISESGNNKNFKLGIGAQLSFRKKRKCIYSFVDLIYTNIFSTGLYSGGTAGYNNTFASTSNGLNTFFGFGLKLKILRSIYLSPELGYTISFGHVNYSTTNLRTGITDSYYLTQVDGALLAKLQITVRF